MRDMRLTGTTDGSGDLTVTGTGISGAWLYAVEWIDGDLADGVDAVLSIINTASGANLTVLTLTNANSDAWYFPRLSEHDNTGTAVATQAYPVLNGTPQLVISSGGATATGGCILYYFN